MSSTASAESAEETGFRKTLALETMQSVDYFDDTGKRLDFDAFMKLVATGRSFDIAHPTRTSAAVSIAAKGAPAPRPSVFKLAPGVAFPKFNLRNNRGAKVGNSALTGKLTLVNFLFATCAPCIAELPVLNAFARSHPRIQSLGVTFDNASEAGQFVRQRHFEWPLITDAQSLIDAVGVTSYPAFALVGGDGRILALSTSHEIAGKSQQLDVDLLAAWIDGAQRGQRALRNKTSR